MNNEYQNDLKHYVDITPVVDMKEFVTLLLVDLASKNDHNIAMLPMDFKSRIEQIMYEENSWGIEFSKFIDINEYYEHQKEWEHKLGNTINIIFFKLKKDHHITFDFETDNVAITFKKEEIEGVKEKYDQETLETMRNFSNLIGDYTLSRKFKIDRRENERFINREMEKRRSLSVSVLRANEIK